MAAVAIVGALYYARGSAGVVLYRLLTDGLIALAWLGSAAGTGAFLLRLFLRIGAPRGADGTNEKKRAAPHMDVAIAPLANVPINGILYFTTAAALGLGAIGLATLGLGLFGLLSQITSIALLLPGLPLGWLALRARQHHRAPTHAATDSSPSYSNWLWIAAAPFLAIALICTMVPPGLLWNPEEPHGYDVAEYHLQVPREWYEAGRIVPLKHNVFSYFPMGVEMHYLLAMEIAGGPWEGMYLAQLMHLAMIVLTVLAVWGIAIGFASNRAAATVAAVALATIPWMAQLGAIAYNEGGLLLYGTLAIGWAMRGLPDTAAIRSRRFALAGTMAGLACGAKLTAVPELLLGVPLSLVVIQLLRDSLASLGAMGKRTRLPVEPVADPTIHGQASTLAHGTHSTHAAQGTHPADSDHRKAPISGPGCTTRSSVLRISLVYIVAGAIAFLPWLARNGVWTGNPVFPEAANFLGKAHLNEVQIERLKRANHEPGADQRGAIGHLRALWDQVLADWQFGYLLLPLGIVSIVLMAVRTRGTFIPSRRTPIEDNANIDPKLLHFPSPVALLPAIMLLFLTVFWIGFTHLQSRFFLLAGPLAVFLIAQVDWGRWLRPIAGLAIVAAVISFWGINERFVSIVWRSSPDMRSSMVDALGRNSLEWLNPAELDEFPRTPEALRDDPNAHITLVGDSRAFYYQVPMSRLSYRTIFDLDTTGLPPAADGPALIAAWSGRPLGSKPPPGEWLVIDGAELKRFSKTYYGVPPPPAQWADRSAPLVLRPGG